MSRKYKRAIYLKSPQMYGEDVKDVQRRLNKLGHNCKGVDGYFGPNTEKSVKEFQKKRKIDVDGSVGPITWNELFNKEEKPSKPSKGKKKIYIDSGHGGKDPGATGYGLQEKDVVLKISKYQKQLLEERGYVVKLSRDTDETLSLEQRTNEANKWGADLFISNHCNAFNKKAKGSETFYGFSDKEGKIYANDIASKLGTVFSNRGAKTKRLDNGKDYFYVIREADMTSIIIEHGFIDNKEDNNKLQSNSMLKKLATLVVESIVE